MLEKFGDIDLLIENDDMVLDAIGVPVLVTGRDCIVQDIKHMLRDKGYLILIIAERDKAKRAVILANIEQEIENDVRIKPGFVRVSEIAFDEFLIAAETLLYGPIEFSYR